MAELRFHRYKVTHVFGCMKGRSGTGSTLTPGTVRSHTWRVFDMNAVKAKGGFSGKLLGRVTESNALLKLTGRT